MIALAFFVIGAGLLLAVAGVSGSSLASTLQGKPDKSKAVEPATAAEVSAAEASGMIQTGAAVNPRSLLSHAISQLGVPYQWGGELERVAFDCSGLVQWAAGKAGIHLPRTAQAQYNATKRIGPSEAQAGDLVFFGGGAGGVSHVGIVTGQGTMIDAPHTGAQVRYDSFPTQLGSSWGSEHVVGYGRP